MLLNILKWIVIAVITILVVGGIASTYTYEEVVQARIFFQENSFKFFLFRIFIVGSSIIYLEKQIKKIPKERKQDTTKAMTLTYIVGFIVIFAPLLKG